MQPTPGTSERITITITESMLEKARAKALGTIDPATGEPMSLNTLVQKAVESFVADARTSK